MYIYIYLSNLYPLISPLSTFLFSLLMEVSGGWLLCVCQQVQVVAPRYHFFGHIHEDGGKQLTFGKELYSLTLDR